MKFYTCHRCEQIGFHEDELDGKRICGRCLRKLQHGEDVFERCARRGYHQTWTYSRALVVYGPFNVGHSYPTRVECLCGESVTAALVATESSGFLIKIPNPAKFWAIVDWQYTPLSESEVSELAVEQGVALRRMTQRELKERLDPKWDDVQVGSSDDFGDIEEIYDVEEPTDGPFACD